MLKRTGFGQGYGYEEGDGGGCNYIDGTGYGDGDEHGDGRGDGHGDGSGCAYSHINKVGGGWGDGVSGYGSGGDSGRGAGSYRSDTDHVVALVIDDDPVTLAYQAVIMQTHKE